MRVINVLFIFLSAVLHDALLTSIWTGRERLVRMVLAISGDR
jgi:hypothetical protein